MCVAAAVGGAAVIGAGASIYSSSQAANAQEQASQNATNAQLSMFNTTQQNLEPYNTSGQNALSNLNSQLPSLTAPISMTQQQLEQTPGYQFQLQQGLESTQNGFAAQGLGSSGAALKGAATYATGLANSNYQQQFQNALTNKENTYNMLSGVAGLGENAGATVGNAATNTGSSIGNNLIGSGNAQAASYLTGGAAVSNAASSIPSYMLMNSLIQNGDL